MTAEKAALRRQVRQTAAALDEAARRESDGRIIGNLTGLPEYRRAERVLAFCGVGGEIDTLPLLARVLAEGKALLLPRCHGGGRMDAARVRSLEDLTDTFYGIPQPGPEAEAVDPGEIDLALVPGLAFDRDGYRLGQGGGYYDRFLPKLEGVTVGLCREACLMRALPREPHDAGVLVLVTEKEIARLY